MNYFSSYVIWIFVTFFYCFQYVLRLLPNIIRPELMQQFSLNATEFGTFAGMYYIGYVLIHIPVGILLSKYGSKKILPPFVLIAALGLLPILLGFNFLSIVAGRLFVGIGSSAAIVGAFQIFRSLFPHNFSQVLGVMVSVGLLTAVFVSKPLIMLRDMLGVHNMLSVIIIAGFLLAFVCFIFLPKEKTEKSSVLVSLKTIFTTPKFLISSILAGCMVGPLEGFADGISTSFLVTLYNIERSVADSISFFILVGMCVGALVLPYFADKTKQYYVLTALCGFVMTLSFFILFFMHASVFMLYVLFFVIGFCSAYQVIILSKIASYVVPEFAGMTGAIANMIVMTFGYFFHTMIGILLDFFWRGSMAENIRIYDTMNYIKALSIIPLMLFFAAIIFLIFSYQETKKIKERA